MDIFDMINAKELATYYTENQSNKIPFLGATLFPAKKILGLDLSWIRGSAGLPVALQPGVFDAKAPVRDRIGVAKIETEMPFFRESMRIGEKDRQQLLTVAAAANRDMLMPLIAKIYDDQSNLVAGASVQFERMRMQLLSTGKIDVSANRVPYTYDYKLKTAQKKTLTSTAMWSDTDNSNPVADIKGWQDNREDETGVRPKRAICTRTTWNYLLENKKIRLDMNPIGGQNIIMTDDMLAAYLQRKLGLTVVVYNKKFALTVGGAAQQFFPDDVFTLIPDGTLGGSYFGTSPEEADLLSGKSRAQVQIVDTGVAITTMVEEHPVNNLTIVSFIGLPSFEAIDQVFIATVA